MNDMDTETRITQASFAELVDVSQPTVHRMVRDGILPRGGTLRAWLRAYIAAIEAERDALAGSADDSTEARAARLALTRATTKLRQQQTKMLVREYEAAERAYIAHLLDEVQAVLYRQLPAGVVGRLLHVIAKQEDRYAASDVFRELIADAVERVQRAEFDHQGLLAEDAAAAPIEATHAE